MKYEYLVAIVKDAIFGACDGTAWKDDFDKSVRLPEMFGEQIEKFAERIATEIHSKLSETETEDLTSDRSADA